MTTLIRLVRAAGTAARRGQAMVEFGLVIGLFMLVIGGILQFGVILWSQNTITEVARDTARYAVTLPDSPCNAGITRGMVATAANQLAREASLIGYANGQWSSAPSATALGPEGIGVDWQSPDSSFDTDCPPSDNLTVWTVRVQINHVVPIFLPGLQIIAPPCGANGFCLTTETELRMEPKRP
jgi:Flp pilus assembly protein TadG